MSLLGYPLASSYQDLTPLQEAFLEVALPRVEMRRQGIDPDEKLETGGDEKPSVPTEGGEPFSLSDYANRRRAEEDYQEE